MVRCRNEKLAIKVLAESTLAAQDGCIYYLAAAASLQQWGQAALAFLVLRRSERGLSAAQLCEAVESTLEGSFRVSIADGYMEGSSISCHDALSDMLQIHA